MGVRTFAFYSVTENPDLSLDLNMCALPAAFQLLMLCCVTSYLKCK